MSIDEQSKQTVKRAHSLLEAMRQENSELYSKREITNEEFLKVGMAFWPLSYKTSDDDDEAFQSLYNGIDNIPLKVILTTPGEQCWALWCARWIDQGCPRVVFDATYASLLMATDVGKDMIDKVVFPWKAFLMELPENLLSIKDEEKVEHGISRVLVHKVFDGTGKERINIVALTNNGLQLWRHGVPVESLATTMTRKENIWDIGIECDSWDGRVLSLLGRLVISLCVCLSDPDNYRKQNRKKGRSASLRQRRFSGLPEIQTFVVGKPVKINCHSAIRAYLVGQKKGSSPTVQFLVRGHWKYQPYGPKHSKRKLIRIDPYWKGPETAHILTKTIQMGEDKEQRV